MLKLSPRNADTFWLDILPGVRVEFRPITVAMQIVARRSAGEVFRSAAKDEAETEPTDDIEARADVAIVHSLVHQGIKAWEGVGDVDGAPIGPSPASIDMLLGIWAAYDAIDRAYVGPAFAREAEKNA